MERVDGVASAGGVAGGSGQASVDGEGAGTKESIARGGRWASARARVRVYVGAC